MNDVNTVQLAEESFEKIKEAIGALPGWWAILRFGSPSHNPIFITGPYRTEQRAAQDAVFFQVSRGDVIEHAVVGSNPPDVPAAQ